MRLRPMALLLTLGLTACEAAPLSLSQMDRTDDLVRFRVVNRSDVDVRSAEFVVRYEVEGQEGVRADTIRYEATRDTEGAVPFVRAGDETFFPHRLPEGGLRASAEVISVVFEDGSSWNRE